MEKLKAIIVEDEPKGRDTLRNMLARFCPDVALIGEAATVAQGAELIEQQLPDLVFLDIELPEQNGFALLEYFPKPNFSIVFTTAYDQYAVQAFRISAVDYLLKPINFTYLRQAVKRVQSMQAHRQASLQALATNVQAKDFKKIALPAANGYHFIDLDRIIACEADRNYTLFHLEEGKKIIVAKPLKHFEDLLCDLHFFRINRSFIINLHCLQSYVRTQKGEVLLKNGMQLSLSEQKKAAFLERVNLLS
ncbi:MAG: LytTR family DNA-binding domain-containing protein [Bacteroidota bacterium]